MNGCPWPRALCPRLHLCLGGTCSFFGGTGPRNALQWHRACYFLSGHNPSLEGHNSRLGAQAVIWGDTALKGPP